MIESSKEELKEKLENNKKKLEERQQNSSEYPVRVKYAYITFKSVEDKIEALELFQKKTDTICNQREIKIHDQAVDPEFI